MKTLVLKNLALAGLLCLTADGCKKARYGIVKPGKETQVTTAVTEQNSSFKFEATPGTTSPNKAVTFAGSCTSSQKHDITWDFGDQSATATGDNAAHEYREVGSYTATAVCTLANDHKMSATVKITVITEDNGGPNANNPNQGPVQSTPDQSTPDQSTP